MTTLTKRLTLAGLAAFAGILRRGGFVLARAVIYL